MSLLIDSLIKPPFNYIGGKNRLLPQINKYLPQNIDICVDLFCGGTSFGINIVADRVIFNDIDKSLIGLLKYFKKESYDNINNSVFSIIDRYNLSDTNLNGYEFYNSNSQDGLGKCNKQAYINLKQDFNNLTTTSSKFYSMLYVLIIFGYNNQIRFNNNGKYNIPVGKRDFNINMQNKLDLFCYRIKNINCEFYCKSFENVDLSMLTEKSLVYVDPPYLLSLAGYNENGRWNEKKENKLYSFLNDINRKKIKFVLSNVITAKGNNNDILAEWVCNNNYNLIELNYNYSNSSYNKKNKKFKEQEVLITNY